MFTSRSSKSVKSISIPRPAPSVAPLVYSLLLASALALPAFGQDFDLKALESRAQNGDVTANLSLAETYLYGLQGLDQDAVRAEAFFASAAQTEDPEAQRLYGEALLWGTHLDQDLPKAQNLLAAAAAKGDVSAGRLLGQQLLGGWVLPQNVSRGKALLEEAIKQGDVQAHVDLAQFYLYGPLPRDWRRAEQLARTAAEAGNGQGLIDVGGMIMWKNRGWQKAEALLEEAAGMGLPEAWTVLAEGAMYGYLGPKSRRKFDGYADKARSFGQERVAVLEAERRIWGISQRASGPKTLAGLEEAARAGNSTALKYLIALTRDGNRYNIRKEPERAAGYLQTYAVLLTAEEREQFALTIEAAKINQARQFAQMAEKLRSKPELLTASFYNELYKANPNVVFYMVQQQAKKDGSYRGAMDGLAGPKTVKATFKACVDLPYAGPCETSIFKPQMVGQLLLKR